MVLHSLGPDVTLDGIVKGLPEKIRRMDKIVESKQFEYVAASSVINVPVPEVAKPNEANRRGNCPNSIIHYQKGFVGTSEKIVALKEDLFKELVIFEKTMDQLRQLALEYVPKEEDGNNTGVAIQQLARNHVNTYHAWAKARLSRKSDDFNDRGSLVDKIVRTTATIDLSNSSNSTKTLP